MGPTRRWFHQVTENERSRKAEDVCNEMPSGWSCNGSKLKRPGDKNDDGFNGLEGKRRSGNHCDGSLEKRNRRSCHRGGVDRQCAVVQGVSVHDNGATWRSAEGKGDRWVMGQKAGILDV